MKKQQNFYHVTTKDKLEAIQREGLLPKIGSSSLLAGETEAAVYLCSYKGIAYWSIVLDAPVVLKVRLESEQLKKLVKDSSAGQNEYALYERILPECLSISTCPDKTKTMKALCIEMIYNAGALCTQIVNHRRHQAADVKDLCVGARVIVSVLNHLDWTSVSEERIRNALLWSSYGGGSIMDRIEGKGCRLYEGITLYSKEDELKKETKALSACLRSLFGRFADVETGKEV